MCWLVNETWARWQGTCFYPSIVSVCERVTSKWKWKMLLSWVRTEDSGTSNILTAVSKCPIFLFRPVKVSFPFPVTCIQSIRSVQLQADCSCHWLSTTQYFQLRSGKYVPSVMSFFLTMCIACTSKKNIKLKISQQWQTTLWKYTISLANASTVITICPQTLCSTVC